MITLNDAITRARAWGHSDNGRVITALREIFATSYTAGTNLELVFLDAMRGTPYGSVDRCMDKVVDCAELIRGTFYIFHGIDIGNFTDAQYKSGLGTTISKTFADIYDAKPLDVVFYDTSSSKITGHVAIVYDNYRIIHSGASENGKKVGYSKKTWNKKKFICIRRFLTDAQIANVTVGGTQPVPEPKKWTCSRTLKPGMKGEDVYNLELALEAHGFNCGITKKEHETKIGNFGPKCKKALRDWQAKNPECGTNGKPDNKAGPKTVTKLGGVWTGK
jgi:hypothetical protein